MSLEPRQDLIGPLEIPESLEVVRVPTGSGQIVEFPVPLAEIDAIVCRNVPEGTFPTLKRITPTRLLRFAVDAFVVAYDSPKLTPDGYRGAIWTLQPSGKPTIEEIPEDPHAQHS